MTNPVDLQKRRKPALWKVIVKWVFIFFLFVLTFLLIFLSIHTKVTSNEDSYVYDLHFEPGTEHRIIQGYGGLFSHKNIAALDFDMPVGTPICAAREGMIFSYKDDSNEGGPFTSYKQKANYIIIKHSDGSFGCYWHLKQHGVVVKQGFVAKGQLIGYSGSTGFVFSPHLHFSVKLRLGYDKDYYTKTKFLTTSGVQFLNMWRVYKRPAQ